MPGPTSPGHRNTGLSQATKIHWAPMSPAHGIQVQRYKHEITIDSNESIVISVEESPESTIGPSGPIVKSVEKGGRTRIVRYKPESTIGTSVPIVISVERGGRTQIIGRDPYPPSKTAGGIGRPGREVEV